MANVNSYWYHKTVSRLREFFISRGFIEIHPGSRQSFLAIAGDVSTIMTYNDGTENYLLPQSAHMWLEFELLKNPELPGVFCCSTSYRQHKNPVPGRHENIFPIFDFETSGGIQTMVQLQRDLLEYLDFNMEHYNEFTYENLTLDLGVKNIDAVTESVIGQNISPTTIVTNKPETLNPSWSSKREGHCVKTSDAVLFGMETIGASERGTQADLMRKRFYTMHDGNWAQTLFDTFGQNRVERELGEFLSLNFFPRSTGSIGLTRMIRALRELDIAKQNASPEVPYFEAQATKIAPNSLIFNN